MSVLTCRCPLYTHSKNLKNKTWSCYKNLRFQFLTYKTACVVRTCTHFFSPILTICLLSHSVRFPSDVCDMKPLSLTVKCRSGSRTEGRKHREAVGSAQKQLVLKHWDAEGETGSADLRLTTGLSCGGVLPVRSCEMKYSKERNDGGNGNDLP